MNKQELFDFVNSYKILLMLENKKWESNKSLNNIKDFVDLKLKVTEIMCHLAVWITCKDDYSKLVISASDDFIITVLDELNDLIIDMNLDTKKHKFNIYKQDVQASISIEAKNETIKDLFAFCIESIEKLIEIDRH